MSALSFQGMHVDTGRAVSGIEHVWQSVRKILTTPIGSRVMRRDFGSRIPDLIDAPLSPRVRLQLIAATAAAILRWEPRIRPLKIGLTAGETLEGAATLTIELTAILADSGESLSLAIPLHRSLLAAA